MRNGRPQRSPPTSPASTRRPESGTQSPVRQRGADGRHRRTVPSGWYYVHVTPEPNSAVRRRVAAIDCGTNAIRLLVADAVLGTGPRRGRVELVDVHRE